MGSKVIMGIFVGIIKELFTLQEGPIMQKIISGFLIIFCLASNAEAEHIEKMFSPDVLAAAPTFASCATGYYIQTVFTKNKNKKKELQELERLNFKTSVYLYAMDGWLKGDRPADRKKAEIKATKFAQKRIQEWNKVFTDHGQNPGQKGRVGFNKMLSDCEKNEVARKFYLPKLESVMEDSLIIEVKGNSPVKIPLGATPFHKQK